MSCSRLDLSLTLLLAAAAAGCGDQQQAVAPDGGVTAAGPDPAFFRPVASDVLLFSFKGRVDAAGTPYEEQTLGQGTFTVKLGQAELKLWQDPSAEAYQVPQSHPDPALRGRRYVYLAAYEQQPGDGSATAAPRAMSLALPADGLRDALKAGGEARLPAAAKVTLLSYRSTLRRDRVSLLRYCYLAVQDPGRGSKLHVETLGQSSDLGDAGDAGDAGSADALADGAAVGIWGNIALTDAPAALLKASAGVTRDAQTGLHCRYTKGGKPVTRQQYYAALEIDVELACPVPGALTKPLPGGGAQLRYVFSGKINTQTEVSEAGVGTFSVALAQGGKAAFLEQSSMQYAVLTSYRFFTPSAKPAVGMVGIGAVESLGAGHLRYRMVTTYLSTAALAALTPGSTGVQTACAAGDCIIAVTKNEELKRNGARYTRTCPVALDDKAAGSGGLFVCRAGGAVGSQLQLAVNLPLSDDPIKIQTKLGLSSPCYCVKGQSLIPCTDFPAP